MKLEERMKLYESQESNRHLIPLLPVMARMDGRAFHNFTRNLARPFDIDFHKVMVETTRKLLEETNANLGATHSDEISLCWLPKEDIESQIFFNGNIQKMVSTLSALTSVYFIQQCQYNETMWDTVEEYDSETNFNIPLDNLPTFDARVWNVPNLNEAANVFLWREYDATRNSIQMAARAYYSHNECDGKNSSQLQDMLIEKGINWNDYPVSFKRGTYLAKRGIERKFTIEEIGKLPKNHEARKNPNLIFFRQDILELEFPPLSKIGNLFDVIFFGVEPIYHTGI